MSKIYIFLVIIFLSACGFQVSPNQSKVSPTDSNQSKVIPAETILRNSLISMQNISDEHILGEVGKVSVDQPDDSTWYQVDLIGDYLNPVVIMQPLSFNDSAPATVRLQNVQSTSFEFQIDEWDYLDGSHGTEEISYIVMETGVHELAGGFKVEAGTVQGNHQFLDVTFEHFYDQEPVVLTQVQTVNEAEAVTTRVRKVRTDVRRSSFQVQIEEEEANDNIHALETIGYIVFEEGNGTTNGSDFVAAVTPDAVNHFWYTVTFPGTLTTSSLIPQATLITPIYNEPLFFAAIQSVDGGDTATLRYRNLTTSGVEFFLEEETSSNAETSHTTEEVGYVAFAAGFTYADPIANEGFAEVRNTKIISITDGEKAELGQVEVSQFDDSEWFTVSLRQTYNNPVVIMQPISYQGSDPANVRIRNVTLSSFEFQIEEWDYLDGNHPREIVHYMVVEVGEHDYDGLIVKADKVNNVNHSFQNVTFSSSFSAIPVVLAQAQTVNDSSAIAMRLRNVSAVGFDVRVQEEENNPQAHGNETVGYIALAAQDGIINAGSSGTVGSAAYTNYHVARTPDAVRHNRYSLSFPANLDHHPSDLPIEGNSPFFFASLQTYDGPNTASVRYLDLDYNGTDVFVDEEQSRDSETNHTTEVVGYAAFDGGFGIEVVIPAPAFQEVSIGPVASGMVFPSGSSYDFLVANNFTENKPATHFGYEQRNVNNASVEACVNTFGHTADLLDPNPYGKSGVMLRQDNSTTSFYAFVGMTPTGTEFEYLNTNNSVVQRITGSLPNVLPDALPNGVDMACYRLEQTGTTTKAYESPDGVTWTQVGSDITINLTNQINIGVAVSTTEVALISTISQIVIAP